MLIGLRNGLCLLAILLPSLPCGLGEEPEEPMAPAEAEEAPSPQQPVSPTAPAMVPRPATPKAEEADPPTDARVDLVTLLDLAPVGTKAVVAIRDAEALFGFLQGITDATDLDALAAGSPKTTGDAGREALDVISLLTKAAAHDDLDLSRGVLVLDEPEAILYASKSGEPSALKTALEHAGASAHQRIEHCVDLPSAKGYHACSDDAASLAMLAVGGRGRSLVAELSDALPDVDLRNSNTVGLLQRDDVGAFALDVEPGRIHVAMAFDLPDSLRVFEPGPPTALELAAPGAPFAWMRLTEAFHVAASKELPGPVRTVSDSLTREWVATVLPDGALTVLGGVTDPYPAASLVALASLSPDRLAAELPPKAVVEVVELEAHEEPFRALHLRYDEGPIRDTADRFGLTPEAWGFSAGHHVGLVVGSGALTISKVVDGRGGQNGWTGYPPQLAAALESESCSAALFLPLDPLQAALDRELALAILEARGVLSPALAGEFQTRTEAFRSFSNLAFWLTQPEDVPVVHVSLDTFGNTVTDEGKDALRTLAKIEAGAPPAAAYEALAAKYPDTPRYRQRVGETSIGRALALIVGLFPPPPAPKRAAKRREPASGRTVPSSVLEANAIYTPGPNQREIAAVSGPESVGFIRVGYCVSKAGKVTNVRVKGRRGKRNPKLDAVVVDTVKKWRFKPVFEGGTVVERCSTKEFAIRHD